MQNLQGGNIAVQVASWNKWATVQERSGSIANDYQNRQWRYSTTVAMRYERERPTRSNDTIDFRGERYEITSVRIVDEAHGKWEVCEVNKIDNSINSDAPVETDNIKVLNYTAANAGSSFTETDLIGYNVFGAFKDGVQFKVITGTVNPNEKEVSFNVVTGQLTWSVPFVVGERALIQYY